MYYSETTKGFYPTLNYANLPDDLISITTDEHLDLLYKQGRGEEIFLATNGRVTTRVKVVPPGQERKEKKGSVRKHIDDEARNRGFDSILEAISYADEPAEPVRQALGVALRTWRSACMVVVDAALDGPGQPPSATALIASLPDFVAL